jgi:hypothetical protein
VQLRDADALGGEVDAHTWPPLRAIESERDAAAATDVDDALPARPPAVESIHCRRSGLIWCQGRESLSASHQRWQVRELREFGGSAFS